MRNQSLIPAHRKSIPSLAAALAFGLTLRFDHSTLLAAAVVGVAAGALAALALAARHSRVGRAPLVLTGLLVLAVAAPVYAAQVARSHASANPQATVRAFTVERDNARLDHSVSAA